MKWTLRLRLVLWNDRIYPFKYSAHSLKLSFILFLKTGYLIFFHHILFFFQDLSFLSTGLFQIHAYLKVSALEYYILLGNLGGLSLTSVRVMFTVVVPASPPSCPPMSLAWIRTWYCSFTSLSIFGKAVLITPMRRKGKDKKKINKGLWLSTLTN